MEQPLLIHRPKRKAKESNPARPEEVCNTDKLKIDTRILLYVEL